MIIANDIKVFRKYILCDAIYEFWSTSSVYFNLIQNDK